MVPAVHANKPTKADMIDQLRRVVKISPDGRASLPLFEKETGWGIYWFDKHWPTGGYPAACEEAGVNRGLIIGVETCVRVTDEQLAVKLADAVHSIMVEQRIGRVPTLKRFVAVARLSSKTITRGETYPEAKWRIIRTYFALPAEKRKDEAVDRVLREELDRLDGSNGDPVRAPGTLSLQHHAIQVPPAYLDLVRDFRDRGEEEKRQLVAQFFHNVLGYRRARVRSEHKHNDVRVHDRRDRPWLVVEVKPLLETERHRRAARRQGFDYAHRLGMRFVVISDGDFYEIFDRCAGQRLRYDEMRQGSFHLSALRSRDSDLLSLLAAER
jgi:hypothetical protein